MNPGMAGMIGHPGVIETPEIRAMRRNAERLQDLMVLSGLLTQAAQTLAAGSSAMREMGLGTVKQCSHELGKWLEQEEKK